MKIELELVPEQIEAIVVQELKEQYGMGLDYDPWDKHDKKYNKKLMKALKRVLEYNMTSDEAEEFFDD